jgi:hypothetical protein
MESVAVIHPFSLATTKLDYALRDRMTDPLIDYQQPLWALFQEERGMAAPINVVPIPATGIETGDRRAGFDLI